MGLPEILQGICIAHQTRNIPDWCLAIDELAEHSIGDAFEAVMDAVMIDDLGQMPTLKYALLLERLAGEDLPKAMGRMSSDLTSARYRNRLSFARGILGAVDAITSTLPPADARMIWLALQCRHGDEPALTPIITQNLAMIDRRRAAQGSQDLRVNLGRQLDKAKSTPVAT